MARVKRETLFEALAKLRYAKVGEDEWRFGKFHLFIKPKGKRGINAQPARGQHFAVAAVPQSPPQRERLGNGNAENFRRLR